MNRLRFWPDDRHDPLAGCLAIAAAFLALALWHLAIPSKPMFDEIHYLPAARNLLRLSKIVNPEHPLLGKEAIALSLRLFGDNPFGWRAVNAMLGALGVFAAQRALWWASGSARATLLFGVLFATDFLWFVLARIAMLDMAMGCALALMAWHWARAWRAGVRGETARAALALTGLWLGLSLAAKWNAAPLAAAPGMLFAWERWRALPRGGKTAWLTTRAAAPVPGVSLVEAAGWLGLLPLVAYFLTFAPDFLYATDPLTLRRLLPYQRWMWQLQDSVVKPHHYMSHWWQWMLNLRPIWFLYEPVDGAQRGVLMIGNPFTMLALLPALLLCAWDAALAALQRAAVPRARLKGGLVLLYAGSLAFWAVNGKPVQFYYHYVLAASFGVAALALVLAEWWDDGVRWPAWGTLAASLALFAWFYPILAAAPLPGRDGYVKWMWLDSWR